MSSLAHRARQRRVERAPLSAPGNINLVPLVDILTSIVFFSLLTYRGELLAQLTAYDLSLPPVVVSTPRSTPQEGGDRALRLVVRVGLDAVTVEHTAGAGLRRAIGSPRGAAVDTLGAVLRDVRRQYPDGRDVRVVPADAVVYDDVVRVLEQLRVAGFTAIALDTGAGMAPAPRAP